jgi:prepilin-type N-terminal cleavage/methylation domain-containing protein
MKHNINKTGFTIAELLVALAISSLLLTAVAFAFQSSMMNYKENEDIFKVTNSARQALFRMTTQLRTANAIDDLAPNNQCTFITSDGENITYDYRNADNKLYLITNSDGSEYVLCDNVTAMTFALETFVDPEDGFTKVKSVQMSMTVVNGNIEKTISAAAVIRRNLN